MQLLRTEDFLSLEAGKLLPPSISLVLLKTLLTSPLEAVLFWSMFRELSFLLCKYLMLVVNKRDVANTAELVNN